VVAIKGTGGRFVLSAFKATRLNSGLQATAGGRIKRGKAERKLEGEVKSSS
jgi:hypothetical protein